MASGGGGDDVVGKFVFAIVIGLFMGWLWHIEMVHGLLALGLVFALIVLVIVLPIDQIWADSKLGERLARRGYGNNREAQSQPPKTWQRRVGWVREPGTTLPDMQTDYQSLDGAPRDWSATPNNDEH